MVQQYRGHLPSDGAQIMLNNTLESPHERIPELPLLYQSKGLEHKRAKRVKDTVPVLVCLGNPPYDRHAAATKENQTLTGSWVRWGELKDGKDAILEDFIAPVRAAGKGGSLKNLYNLYVYFWRWALWKTFEHDLAAGPGIVSFITASSFIDGDAFLGMRTHMRQVCDEIWVIDLGGEGRGTRMDENVFAIKTPVAITVAVRYGGPQLNIPAKVHYTRIEGTRSIKLHSLEILQSLNDLAFSICPNEWNAPFRPEEKGSYVSWPLLTDLIPWQHSGVQAKRVWPIGTTKNVLNKRWQHMLKSNRAECFKDRLRTIYRIYAADDPEYYRIIYPPKSPRKSPPQVKGLLKALKGEMNRDELQVAFGLQDRKSFSERYLKPALNAELIEMTIPEKPNSRLQKYRLTGRGRKR